MLIGPPIGSILMDMYSPQTAYLWTIPPRVVSLGLLFMIPETSQRKPAAAVPGAFDGSRKPLLTIIRGKMVNLAHHVVHNIVPIISQLPVLLGLVSFIVNAFAVPLLGLVMQYMSSRFHWKLSQVRGLEIAALLTDVGCLGALIPSRGANLTPDYGTPVCGSALEEKTQEPGAGKSYCQQGQHWVSDCRDGRDWPCCPKRSGFPWLVPSSFTTQLTAR